jgi:hypothetical protein
MEMIGRKSIGWANFEEQVRIALTEWFLTFKWCDPCVNAAGAVGMVGLARMVQVTATMLRASATMISMIIM